LSNLPERLDRKSRFFTVRFLKCSGAKIGSSTALMLASPDDNLGAVASARLGRSLLGPRIP
jgi:hypothetical protein